MPVDVEAAVHIPGQSGFQLNKLSLDDPREDEILVAIKAVGLCHTDIVGVNGGFGYPSPIVFGHEGAGIVERVGSSVRAFSPGDRVLLTFRSCGLCRKCSSGHPSYCSDFPLLNYSGLRADGTAALSQHGNAIGSNFFGQSSFASHALTYAENMVRLPDRISFETAAPFGCAVQTGAGSILNSLACPPGSTLVIAGAGPVGLSAVMGAKIAQCSTIVVIEPEAERRNLSLELGATLAIDPRDSGDIGDAINRAQPDGFEFALDTTGRGDVLEALLASLAPQGRLGCVGIGPRDARLPGTLNGVMKFGHQIMGIIEGDSEPATFLPELFSAYLAGLLPVDRLIKTYPFAEINRAASEQAAGHCIKPVLTFA